MRAVCPAHQSLHSLTLTITGEEYGLWNN